MKTPLWVLLLLSLCVPSRSDCQGDCLTCALLLPPQQTFNTLVCLLECEAQAFPAHSWDLCYQVVGLNPAALPSPDLSKRTEDEKKPLAIMKMEDEGMEYSEALERFRHMAQALSGHEPSEEEQKSDQFEETYDLGLDSNMEDEEEQDTVDKGEEQDQDGATALNLSKRFGGFMKGRHGFRKLVSSGRPLQKRYGGFIGIRKSARKWNNQKRVSQLLRQYLSLTARTGRSGHFANLSAAAVRQKNEV
ncbi:prepronociceptin b [Neoarius graeffei]|uniref:prepronociceptin b n=1 Tax=Neoarius graeffei TaxID=443677 RepID=UPI00298D1089|nr:prepronociceptin b [Neoarius graeffei]